MKILSIHVNGLELFSKNTGLEFFAQQKVFDYDEDFLHKLFSNIYLNPVCALIGINASGKTSYLKLILLALDLINAKPINHSKYKDILQVLTEAEFSICYLSNNKDLVKQTTIISKNNLNNLEENDYVILEEKIYRKRLSSVRSKKELLDFSESNLVLTRSEIQNSLLISEDVSVSLKYIKELKDEIFVCNTLGLTNSNIAIPLFSNQQTNAIPSSLLKFLDPCIEYLKPSEKDPSTLLLKIRGKTEIVISNPILLEKYFSSGTIKGISDFTYAMNVLKNGGILVLDEIENHYNKEIVKTLINLFENKHINKNAASLIFSTHYPELLDILQRSDSIYIVRKKEKFCADNFSTLVKRNDLKKSELYESDFLGGTAPSFEAYSEFEKELKNFVL